MPDTVLPSTGHLEDKNVKDTARIGTPNDHSWAGWAISSFTNKITAADGEIQPTANGNRPVESDTTRSSSVPRPAKSSPSKELNAAKEILRPAAPLNRSVSAQPAPVTKAEKEDNQADDVYEAWGAMDDDDDDWGFSKDDDPFDTAPKSNPSTTNTTTPTTSGLTTKPAPIPYDDGGEPDFAGWLTAQSKAKSKKSLPKGLSKPASTNTRTIATPTTAKPKTAVAPAKKIDTTPKDEEDDWGDAWD